VSPTAPSAARAESDVVLTAYEQFQVAPRGETPRPTVARR